LPCVGHTKWSWGSMHRRRLRSFALDTRLTTMRRCRRSCVCCECRANCPLLMCAVSWSSLTSARTTSRHDPKHLNKADLSFEASTRLNCASKVQGVILVPSFLRFIVSPGLAMRLRSACACSAVCRGHDAADRYRRPGIPSLVVSTRPHHCLDHAFTIQPLL
jgi:hypothetical protein